MNTNPTPLDLDAIRAMLGDRPALGRSAALDLIHEVERLRARVSDEPGECVMTHTPPFDFAQCETHDETFPLGGACRFHGRTSVAEVYADEADQMRARAEKAEAEVARLTARPAPAWDEEVVVEAVSTALHGDGCPEDPDEGESCACSDYLREARIAVAVVREHMPVKPGREGALKRAYRDRQSPIQEEDAWAFGEGVRAGIDAVLDPWPGRTESEVKAEAMPDSAARVREHLPVKSSREAVARALAEHRLMGGRCRCGLDPRLDYYRYEQHVTDAVLDLLPGRSEAEVAAEALREARDAVRASSFWADGSDNYADRVRGYLSARADRLAAEGGDGR